MSKRMAIIVPTRSRPQNVAKVVEAWHKTDAFAHADLLFVADRDDPAAMEYQSAFREAVLSAQAQLTNLWLNERMPLVPKLNKVAPVLATRDYFAIGFAGDDHLPRTHGWAARYLATLAAMETGIVYGDDGYQGERLATQWAMTSDIVRALGRMVPAPVEHLYCDNSIMDLGRALSQSGPSHLRYLPDVLIEHMHPAARKAHTDDQYAKVNSAQQYRRDRESYMSWLTSPAGLLADAARVRNSLAGDSGN